MLAALLAPVAAAQTSAPVARAVLFFSPTCGHCEFVIQEVMPTWFEAHGGSTPDVYFDETAADPPFFLVTNGTLEVLLVNVTVAEGFAMFDATTVAWAIGNEAVPRLVIGNEVAIGSVDIPERVPAILDRSLAAEGIPWPRIEGLTGVVAQLFSTAAEPAPTTTTTLAAATTVAASTTVASSDPEPVVITLGPLDDALDSDSIGERFGRDPVGNGAAVAVLAVMIATVVGLGLQRGQVRRLDSRWIALLAAAGMAVATYLTAIESSGASAVCGPVGDCNAVQQSQYASIFGIHVGVIGIVGYSVMLLAWFLAERDGGLASKASLVLVVAAGGGVLFSIYLTFLEPFVIGATCVWCLTSAMIVTLILAIATPWWIAGRATEPSTRSGTE
jgi:uncharacterized membrane protein